MGRIELAVELLQLWQHDIPLGRIGQGHAGPVGNKLIGSKPERVDAVGHQQAVPVKAEYVVG